jgi:hypothetical protein
VTFTVLPSPADSPRGDGTVRLALTGEMDASNPYRLRPAILDDGADHGAQVASLALEPCGCGLVLCNASRQVRRILEITDIGRTAEVRQ